MPNTMQPSKLALALHGVIRGQPTLDAASRAADELVSAFGAKGRPLTWEWSGNLITFLEDGMQVGSISPAMMISPAMRRYVKDVERITDQAGEPDLPVFVQLDRGRLTTAEWKEVCLRVARARKEPTRTFWLALARAMDFSQIFDFDTLPNSRIADLAARAGPLMAAQFLDLPYPAVVYHYRVTGAGTKDDDPEKPVGMVTLAARMKTDVVAQVFQITNPTDLIIAADFMEFEDDTGQKRLALMGGLAFRTSKLDQGGWEGVVLETVQFGGEDEKQIQRRTLEGVADGVAALSLLLSTRGVETRKEVPSRKLQQKRAQRNKPPLPTVTFVNTKRYLEAARNTEVKGTHASPVPHLRRGHIRRYKAGTTQTGRRIHRDRMIWVKDMIVNARSIDEVHQRDHYEVNLSDKVTIPD